jgi:aubergine-like protein
VYFSRQIFNDFFSITDKYGSSGTGVIVKANYFELDKSPSFVLKQYRVDFTPEIDNTNVKKKIITENRHAMQLETFTFDGSTLYTSRLKRLNYDVQHNNSPMMITFREVGRIRSDDENANQVMNLIFRNAMVNLNLQNIKRNYYDPGATIDIPAGNLQLVSD